MPEQTQEPPLVKSDAHVPSEIVTGLKPLVRDLREREKDNIAYLRVETQVNGYAMTIYGSNWESKTFEVPLTPSNVVLEDAKRALLRAHRNP